MIFLDTSFVIPVLDAGSAEDRVARGWLAQGEALRASIIVWAELLCGPITDEQKRLAKSLLEAPEPL